MIHLAGKYPSQYATTRRVANVPVCFRIIYFGRGSTPCGISGRTSDGWYGHTGGTPHDIIFLHPPSPVLIIDNIARKGAASRVQSQLLGRSGKQTNNRNSRFCRDLTTLWTRTQGANQKNFPPSPGLTVLLHNLQKLHHNLGAGPDQHLSLSALLSVGDGLQSVGEDSHFHHLRWLIVPSRRGKKHIKYKKLHRSRSCQ